MDTKLKNNKKTINRKFLIISLCIAILPILLGLSNGLINTKDTFYEKLNIYDKYISNLMKGIAYNDENGNIRDDAIARETDYLQLGYQCELYDAQKNYEEYSKETNYSTYTLKDLKYKYDEASENFYKSYDEYKKQAIENINEMLAKKNIVTNPVNLEYYIEFKNGQVVNNISERSKSTIIDETKNNSKDYIMFLDIANNSPKQTFNTHNMGYQFDDLIYKNLYGELSNVIIRIPSSLQEGDELYTVTQKNNIANYIGYGALLLLVLDIFILIILVLRLVKEKDIKFENTPVLKLYNKLPIEIKVLASILMLNTLPGLYNIITHWGDDLIENHIAYIISKIPYLHASSSFCIQLFSLFIVTIIIGYLILCDIYQLYLNKTKHDTKQYLYGNSMFFTAYNKFKNSFSNKLMTKKTKFILIIFVLYLTSLIWSTWLFSSEEIFWFYLLHNELDLLTFPPFVYFSSLIINILGTILVIKYIIAFLTDINKIKITTDDIIKGTYKNEIKIKNSSILKELADNIMNIEDGLDKAIDKAVKGEKMKGELITNVSHDLKTPLTSIINYVDLLDNDNLTDEKRRAYLEILKERSQRLKVLIEDLFEASKAASGNLEMHMEDLDPVALLRQTLGEFEDKINISKLEFIKKIPQEKLTIYADGKKTFRVFQNLISNILKYSLNGTRVYIDVEEKEKFVSMTFKNISGYPLNFTEEEILERFKRGDASRTTEGSGLGLSIAKSLVELQGGLFEIKLDGDLFKVVVLLKKQKF